MKHISLLIVFVTMTFVSFSQKNETEKNIEIGIYNGNCLSIGAFTQKNIYPEIRITSRDYEYDIHNLQYSFLLQTEKSYKKLNFVVGLGYRYLADSGSTFDRSYAVLPFEVKKTNLFNTHFSLAIGAELSSNFTTDIKINPLIGIFITL